MTVDEAIAELAFAAVSDPWEQAQCQARDVLVAELTRLRAMQTRRDALKDLTRMTEEVGGYDREFAAPATDPAVLGLVEALKALLIAVRYAGIREFGTPDEPNPCWEARIPPQFVTDAESALAKWEASRDH